MNFQVVRVVDTPSGLSAQSDEDAGDNATVLVEGVEVGDVGVTTTAGTPIPGLRVEIHEEIATTPIAIHEIVTNENGFPSTVVEVDSEADIIVLSKDETIARFQRAGPAVEFAAPAQPTIVATPMIDQVTACLAVASGTPIIEFRYNNKNESAIDASVPITGLTPYLYRTPGTVEDDLRLNSMLQGSDQVVLPDETFRDVAPNETNQLFVNGTNSFTVPFDSTLGPITWSLIGAETVVDSSTALCEGGGEQPDLRCEELSPEKIRRLLINLRRSVTGTLKAAARVMKVGSSPYLKTSSKAIKSTKTAQKALYGALVCPKELKLASNCARKPFPFSQFMKLHQGIFSKRSPVNPKLFKKLQKSYNKAYQSFLYSTFPEEIVFCK
jgi:hypothetical protein